jgi:hypothetical protein
MWILFIHFEGVHIRRGGDLNDWNTGKLKKFKSRIILFKALIKRKLGIDMFSISSILYWCINNQVVTKKNDIS